MVTTTKKTKITIQGGGVRCENIPSYVSTILERDLTFQTPGYATADRQGRYISPDANPTFTLFLKEKNTYWIPRGYTFFLLRNLRKMKTSFEIADKTLLFPENKNIKFIGDLRAYQKKAKKEILRYPIGVLHATTGSGKTTVAINLIVHRKQPTLIIVHSKELLYQWRDRIKQFTGEDCGLIGDGKNTVKFITVGIINSVKNQVKKLTKKFGMIVLDECHRSGSPSHIYVLQEFHAKFFLGLTATPYRSDGLSGIIYASIGPKISTIKIKDGISVLKPLIHRVPTPFNYMFLGDYAALITKITENEIRNTIICQNVYQDFRRHKENIIIVSDRVEHLNILSEILNKTYKMKNSILTGSTKPKEREEIVQQVNEGKVNILLSSTSLIGEGFDCPNLTVLMMATPLKFKGRVIQTCGRILRPSPGKIPRIYDFRDNYVSYLRKSGEHRDAIYKTEGWIK